MQPETANRSAFVRKFVRSKNKAMIRKATESDFRELAALWERSVRATHDFLPEEYLQEIKTLLPSIFPAVPMYVEETSTSAIAGFLGVAEQKIEMLFIDPPSRGKGIGRLLTAYAINELKADKVDVNEQNEQAVGFYKKLGFVVCGRTETDGLGRAFPLLLMELAR